MVVPAWVADRFFQCCTVFLCSFDDATETHSLEARIVERDVAKERAGAAPPAIRVTVVAPAAALARAGIAGMEHFVAASARPLRPETRVRVRSAHRSRKRR